MLMPDFLNFFIATTAAILLSMVGPTELESVTSCVSSRRSNQLSYGPLEKLQYITRAKL